jgi:hypothetical protein
MWSHVQRTIAGCFAALRQIRSVRRSLLSTALETLLMSLVPTWLDYGNRPTTLDHTPANLLHRLQTALNASAATITGLPHSAHITTSLAGLHWLLAAEHIKFKLATLTYRCLHCPASPTTCLLCPLNWLVSPTFLLILLCSSAIDALFVRPKRLVCVGDRAFPAAAAKRWNELSGDVT